MFGLKSKEEYYVHSDILFPIRAKKPMKKTHHQESLTNYLFSIYNRYFSPPNKTVPKSTTKKKSGITLTHNGILPPQKNTQHTFYLTKDTITAPITINYSSDPHQDTIYASDSSLNSSVSSFTSTSSSESYRRNSLCSIITLSEILCEHDKLQDSSQVPPPLTYTEPEEESWLITTDWEKEDETSPVFERSRNIRVNPAHLRMIVAEVNMMRANKIVCPLKLRGSLPPRSDGFSPKQPSPLRYH